jgi:hypothetical protein
MPVAGTVRPSRVVRDWSARQADATLGSMADTALPLRSKLLWIAVLFLMTDLVAQYAGPLPPHLPSFVAPASTQGTDQAAAIVCAGLDRIGLQAPSPAAEAHGRLLLQRLAVEVQHVRGDPELMRDVQDLALVARRDASDADLRTATREVFASDCHG